MKSILQAYWLSLSLIAHDISLLYKNFLHWNLSKLTIWLFAIVAGTILSLPAIGLILWAGYSVLSTVPEASLSLFTTSGDIDATLLSTLMNHTWTLIAVGILCVLVIAIYGYTLTYAYFLELKLYEGYLKGVQLPIKQNLYLSKYHLRKFLGILGWTSLYVLYPIAAGVVILFLLFMLTHFNILSVDNKSHVAILGSLALVGFLGCVAWIVVLSIRMSFGYMLLLGKEEPAKPAREFVTESFALSKGHVWKMLGLIAPFFIFVSTIWGTIGGINNTILVNRAETIINSIAKADPKEFVDDHSYIKRHYLNPFTLNEADIANIIAINNKFNPKTDWVDRQYLEAIFSYLDNNAIDSQSWLIESCFGLITFLLTEGFMIMVYFSVFSIIRNTKSEPEDKPKKVRPSNKKVIEE